MGSIAKLKLSGFEEADRKFARMANKRLLKASTRKAVNAAATPIVKAVRGIWKAEANDTGLSAKSVTKKVYMGRSGYTAIIGIDRAAQGISHGRVHIPANIDHLVEKGFQRADGTTMPAKAPLRRGYAAAKDASERICEAKMKEAIEQEAMKKMSVEYAIVAKLKATPAVETLIASRIAPAVMPGALTRPNITYQRIITRDVGSNAGATGLQFATVQLNLYAGGLSAHVDANSLADTVRATLNGFAGVVGGIQIASCRLDDQFDLPEPPAEGQANSGVVGIGQVYIIGYN